MSSKALVLIGAAFVAVACSSSGGGGGGAKGSVQSAVDATIKAGSVTESVNAVTPTASGTNKSSAQGSYSFTSIEGTFKVDTGSVIGKVTVEVKGSTLYINVPAALRAQTANKAWVSVDMNNPPAVPGVGNLPALAAGADPSLAFEGLQDGVVSATKASDGTYTVKIDLNKAASSAPSARKPLAQRDAKLLGGATVTDNVTVGSDGRISQLVENIALSGSSQPEVVTDTFSGFGTTVSVSLPPASQTVDAATLFK